MSVSTKTSNHKPKIFNPVDADYVEFHSLAYQEKIRSVAALFIEQMLEKDMLCCDAKWTLFAQALSAAFGQWEWTEH